MLITWFEEFVDIRPDVLALSYGRQPQHLQDFLQGYMVTLLKRSIAWATVKGFDELLGKLKSTLSSFEAAVSKIG